MRRLLAACLLASMCLVASSASSSVRETDAVGLARMIDSMTPRFRESRERPVAVVQASPVPVARKFICWRSDDPGFIERYRKDRAAKRRTAIRSWIRETFTGAYVRRWIQQDALNRGWFRHA